MLRRRFLQCFGTSLASALAGFAPRVSAQSRDWPNRPVRVVCPFPPGGNTDVVGRQIATRLSALFGQPFTFDNRPGAGGNIGSDIVAKATPDGYTLLVSTLSTYALNVGLYEKLPYDPQKDLTPIALTVMVPLVIVTHPSLNVGSLQELMRLLRENPGKFNYGSAGNGTSGHIASYLFADMIGAKVQHIPYKGTGPVMTDMLAGRLTYIFDAPSVLAPHIQAGTLRAHAVAMPARVPLLPDVPTMAEAGLKGYEAYSWNAFWAPAGTPEPILDKLHAAILGILADATFREQMEKSGVPIMPASSRADAARFMKAESDKWVPIVKASGARVD
jgi:tripartite-type tricarboxylate transporter receptor subunit TctC